MKLNSHRATRTSELRGQVAHVRTKIGQCLIQAGVITDRDLQTALCEQTRTGEGLGSILVRLNCATEKQITKALAYQLRLSYVSLTEDPPDPRAVSLIPKELALRRGCVAVRLDEGVLTVAVSDSLPCSLSDELKLQAGWRIREVVATRSEILQCIEHGYRDLAAAKQTRRTLELNACPHGLDAVSGCSSCARELQPEWSFCPFCAAPTVAFFAM